MNKMLCILMITLMNVLSGCAEKPSDSEIERQIVEGILGDDGAEILKIENYKKTNGFEKSSKTYIADVEYDVVFLVGIKDLALKFKEEAQGSRANEMQADLILRFMRMQYGDFEAGHRVKREEKVTLIKTENGWRLE